MNILVVHPYMKVFGGGERVCLQIVKALMEEGHNVNLMCEPVKPSALESLLKFNMKNLRHTSLRSMPNGDFMPEIRVFSVYQRLLRHVVSRYCLKRKVGNVDLEFLTQDVAFCCDIGKRRIAYVHFPGYLAHLEKSTARSRLFWKIYYAPIEAYWKNKIDVVDLLLCNSEYTKRAIKRRWRKEAIVVYPPVNIDRFKCVPIKEKFVVTVGRFVPEKNYETVVEVAKLLPDVKFVIIGRKQDAAYYREIERSKPANLTLLPDLPEDEMILCLARAKAYLHAMIGEHFGISIVEAMAAGCIPVIHNSGGAKEIVKDFGYVYDTVEECRECVRQALSKDIDTSTLVRRARDFSSERFAHEIKKKMEPLLISESS